MSFQPPHAPARMTFARVRLFEGVGGDPDRVLRRRDYRGRNISNTIANEVLDFNLAERGTMLLRRGNRKIESTGFDSTVTAIFPVRIGQLIAYGRIIDGGLDVVTMPDTGGFTFS